MDAYRNMLLTLSRELSPDELERMKFYCKEHITRRQSEDITDAVKLWAVLEERCLLGRDNLEFLKNLLGSNHREDLLKIVEDFESHNSSSTTATDFEKEFKHITDKMNIKQWRNLLRKLRVDDIEIDGLAERYHGNVREQIYQGLKLWSRKETATKEILIRALRDCDMNMTAFEVSNLR